MPLSIEYVLVYQAANAPPFIRGVPELEPERGFGEGAGAVRVLAERGGGTGPELDGRR